MAKTSNIHSVTATAPSLEALLADLRDCANRPAEEARAFPPGVYCDEAFHRLELERIFAREWHCIGRTDEWAEPGQYEAMEIAGEAAEAVKSAGSDLIVGIGGGSPLDIARTVLFLARDADYITGQIIAVDGGRTLQH